MNLEYIFAHGFISLAGELAECNLEAVLGHDKVDGHLSLCLCQEVIPFPGRDKGDLPSGGPGGLGVEIGVVPHDCLTQTVLGTYDVGTSADGLGSPLLSQNSLGGRQKPA